MKKKVKSYAFWFGILSGLGLIAKEILSEFGYEIEQQTIDRIVSALLTIACVAGVCAPVPTRERTLTPGDNEQETDPCADESDPAREAPCEERIAAAVVCGDGASAAAIVVQTPAEDGGADESAEKTTDGISSQ